MCKMYTRYFALLGVIALKNVNCYSAHRSPRLTTVKNANPTPQDLVIPARYQIIGKPNYDPTIGQNIHTDGFPEVEYPSSIMDSPKPFYLNMNPFSEDVKSNFRSLVSKGPAKANPIITINLKQSDNKKENIKTKPPASETLDDVNEATMAKGNKVNSNDKSAIETVQKEPLILRYEDNTVRVENSNTEYKQVSTLSPEKETDCGEMDYGFGIIDDLDDFISTFTAIETEIIDINNTTTKIFDVPKEFVTITSDVTLANNESVTELNTGSLHAEPNPLLDDSNDTSPLRDSFANENKNVTQANEMQRDSVKDIIYLDSDSIEKIANDDNTSLMEQ